MAFAYSAELQQQIALNVWNVANASLSATQKAQMDNTWTTGALSGGAAYYAQAEIANFAQWIEQASSTPDTSLPQPSWSGLFVALATWKLCLAVRPDRAQFWEAEYQRQLDLAIDTYSKTLGSAGTITGQTFTPQAILYYVMNHCVRRKESGREQGQRRRIFPAVDDVYAHLQWVCDFLWNKSAWAFRKRMVTLRVKVVAITAGTWAESTKVLTGTFTGYSSFAAGDRLYVTDGTDALTGDYQITATNGSTTITLDRSLSDTAANLTTGDITATVVRTEILSGIASGETFDSMSVEKLYFSGTNQVGDICEFANEDAFAQLSVNYGEDTGQPRFFRIEYNDAGVHVWKYLPIPDASYTFRAGVLIAWPDNISSTTSATEINRFPKEFRTVIRDMTLARVLVQYGASDADRMWQKAIDQTDSLLAIKEEHGSPMRRQQSGDVYNDAMYQCGGGYLGGAM